MTLEEQITAVSVSPQDAVELGAVDGDFFAHYFFPDTVRQKSSSIHQKMWALGDDNAYRYLAFILFRDSAKTTTIRLKLARRISYAMSRTVFYLGKSDAHSLRSIEWIKRRVMTNKLWVQTFGLRKGSKWSEHEIEIINDRYGVTTRVVGAGIEGAVRGLNVDDFRPDFIVLDDVVSEGNSSSPAVVAATNELIFGAVKDTLAPRSEAPWAKMMLLNTPQTISDATQIVKLDPLWTVYEQGVFDEKGESIWPERWSTKELLEEKDSAIRRGMLHVWLREKECSLHSPQGAAFNMNLVKNWEELPEGITVIGIDPTPPPAESDTPTVKRKLDNFVIAVWRKAKDGWYSCDSWAAKAPQPEEWLYKLFDLVRTWRPLHVAVETIANQRMVKVAIETHMRQTRQFFALKGVEDRRKKSVRILDAFGPRLSVGEIFIHPSHTALLNEMTLYIPYVENQMDDYLDASTIAFNSLPEGVSISLQGSLEEDEMDEGVDWRLAP